MSAIDYRLLAGKRVLCAVSGGADSVYLLHNCAEAMRKNGLIVCAAHFNHCLRGAESDRDGSAPRRRRANCAMISWKIRPTGWAWT